MVHTETAVPREPVGEDKTAVVGLHSTTHPLLSPRRQPGDLGATVCITLAAQTDSGALLLCSSWAISPATRDRRIARLSRRGASGWRETVHRAPIATMPCRSP